MDPDIFAPPLLLAVGEAEPHRQRQGRDRRRAGEPRDQDAGDESEGDEDRDRVAGQADERNRADAPQRDGPASIMNSMTALSIGLPGFLA